MAMNIRDRKTPELIVNTFVALRKSGFDLGIDELKAGLSLISTESKGTILIDELSINDSEDLDLDSLKTALELIWCSSRSQQAQFQPIWEQALRTTETQASPVPPPASRSSQAETTPPPKPPPPKPQPTRVPTTPTPRENSPASVVDTAIQPVRAPFTPAEIDQPTDLQSYWPVSRRSMSYSWRYLRRTVAEGPADVVDVTATVQRAAQQGFYLEPVMQRRRYNRAELLLLIDLNGSMMPLHQFMRQIVETARYESNLPEDQVTICYFHNVPTAYVYQDVFLTEPVAFSRVLDSCDRNTSLLIISDAGAARGYRKPERIRATVGAIKQIRRTTSLYAWLNPIPQSRWVGSSAEMIANLVPMFQMDDEGLNAAIDVVRGLQDL